MDVDHDGLVSREEGTSFLRQLRDGLQVQQTLPILHDMDSDKDGSLSRAELHAALQLLKIEEPDEVEERFGAFDKDEDELLSVAEATPLFTWMLRFRKLDKNGDGLLSFKEFNKIAAQRLKDKPEEEWKKSKEEGKRIFGRLDTDGDKRLSPAEHLPYETGTFAGLEALEQLFKVTDTDGDGKLSAEELEQVRENSKFHGSAAFYHLDDWIKRVEKQAEEYIKKVKQSGGEL